MKLTKNELKRIDDTINILESIKENKKIFTDNATLNNINRVLNINFKNLNKKKNVKTFKRGKENHIIEHYNTNSLDRYASKIPSYFYFPFQIKELKKD